VRKSPSNKRPILDRFWEKVEKIPFHTCWEWVGTISAATGYGAFTVEPGHSISAHRAAYELLIETVPSGIVVDHLCRNRTCVNPDHLEPVTQRVNLARGLNGQKTACPRGHPYSGVNLVLKRTPTGVGRACRTCKVEGIRRWRERIRTEVHA